ncbi:Tetraspanin [Madurella fahalii]|uniref:Tetraspanin n=1 Tax=Madurella fahalii TaxID=1157608 RepID=A0ABQ0G3F8_9PEZI
MVSKVQLAYVVADGLILLMGIFIISFCVVVGNIRNEVPTDGEQAARNLLYQRFPLEAGIANSAFVFMTFLVTLPGLATSSRRWLKLGGYLAVLCAIFSMVIGLFLWILTLKTRDDFLPLFASQSAEVKSLMQTRFACCGYIEPLVFPVYVTDATCPSQAAASMLRGCAAPISAFANVFLDNIFTAVFGMVGVDVVFIMATACLLKERKERERFRHIDEKNGAGRI